MKNFVRGATVHLKVNFYDNSGAIVNPSAAEATFSYVQHGGERTFATQPLSQFGDDWSCDWDSSVSDPCVVQVNARTTDPLPVSAVDTEFRLTANCANRELSGD